MRKIFAFFISTCLSTTAFSQISDSLLYPIGIRISVDLAGPLLHLYDPTSLTFEGKIDFDLNGNNAVALEGGYLDYTYSQYNYDYNCTGLYFRAGTDYNLLSPKKSGGKYFAGVGFRYGIAFFSQDVPWYKYENAWGIVEGAIEPHRVTGHFVEVSPGMRAEIFKNVSMGWRIRLAKLIYQSSPESVRPVVVPGIGSISSSISYGFSYYLTVNIPYGKKMIYIKEKRITENTDPIKE